MNTMTALAYRTREPFPPARERAPLHPHAVVNLDARRQPAPGQGMLLDIQAELEYWRRIFPGTEFGDASLPFDDFVPTIKFGYDCFLLFHRQPLAEILPGLRDRYQKTVPRHEQLDWRWADQIVRHAWGRMREG